MSKLLTKNTLDRLYNSFIDLWNNQWPFCKTKKEWLKLQTAFRDLIPAYKDDYWNSHYLFETTARQEYLPLIGEDLKKEMLINTVLPLLQEHVSNGGNPAEMKAFDTFYMSFPASKTSKTKYLIHRFFGDTPKGELLHSACTEQGAYQLHRDFCLHFEASCEGCPFVERYKNIF